MSKNVPQKSVALLTFATGKYKELSKLSRPVMQAYANQWGFDFFELDKSLDSNRPISWSKLLAVSKLLEDYEFVIYLDADVMILNLDENILQELNLTADFAWRISEVNGKSSPNAGVMVFRSTERTKAMLKCAYSQEDLIFDGWWEQASLIRVLGYNDPRLDSGKNEKGNPLSPINEMKLEAKWNSISVEPSVGQVNFRHFAGEPFAVKKLMMIEYLRYFHSVNSKSKLSWAVSSLDLTSEYESVNAEIHKKYQTRKKQFVFKVKSVLHRLNLTEMKYK